MDSRYKGEKLITLSEAKQKFGYTSDHLAYLCRKGFLRGERHGRLWLTSGKAVADYKRRLAKFGRPVKWADSGQFGERFFPANLFLTPTVSFLADARNLGEYLVRLYKSIFTRKRLVYKHIYSRSIRAGFKVGESPFNLPLALLPKPLQLAPWYGEKMVVAPVCLLLLAVFGVYFSGDLHEMLEKSAQLLPARFESTSRPATGSSREIPVSGLEENAGQARKSYDKASGQAMAAADFLDLILAQSKSDKSDFPPSVSLRPRVSFQSDSGRMQTGQVVTRIKSGLRLYFVGFQAKFRLSEKGSCRFLLAAKNYLHGSVWEALKNSKDFDSS